MNPRIVIIPTYNEIENIEAIIRKVMSLEPTFDLLIVDDGSPDGTASRKSVPDSLLYGLWLQYFQFRCMWE